ncbi:MAG: hypothetical protein PHU25_04675 [Deltaproteobacteria bacterium]|nr:hypothetical protein [Deltaproteobacteria bacterium]
MTRNTITACVAFSIAGLLAPALFGCGAGQGRTDAVAAPAPIDDDLLALAPASPDLVLWADMAALRRSALWDSLKVLTEDTGGERAHRFAGVDPWQETDQILITATHDRKDELSFLMLIRGRFDAPRLLDSYVRANTGARIELKGRAGVRTPEYTAVAVTGRTFAIGPEPLVSEVLSLAGGTGSSLRGSAAFKDLALDGGVIGRLRFRRGLAAPDLSRYRGQTGGIALERISGVDASLRADSTVHLSIDVTTENKLDASGLVREIDRLKRKLKRNALVVFIGVDWLVDRFSAVAEGGAVHVTFTLDASDLAEVRRLAERIRKVREIAGEDNADGGLDLDLLPGPLKGAEPGSSP